MIITSYLRRSLFKWKYAILIILMVSALLAALTFQVNRWLPDYAQSFSSLIAQQSQAQISFRTVHYRFPGYIILKNVAVIENGQKNPLLKANKVVLGFSFPLFSSAFPLNSINVDGMTINYPAMKGYLTQHYKMIYAWAETLPKGKMHFLAPNGRIFLADLAQAQAIPFNFDLDLHQDHINVHGAYGNKERSNFELKGLVNNTGIDLEKLTLDNGRSSMNLWGSWVGNNVEWKGFIFYNKIYILDIDGQLRIQKKAIILKQLTFTVNGDAVGASGQCLNQRLFQCDADIAYWRKADPVDPGNNLKNINLHLHAQNTAQGPLLNGTVDLGFLEPDPYFAVQNLHLDFSGLKARIINGNFLVLKIKQLQNVFLAQSNNHQVLLENILASFNLAKPFQKIITLSAEILGGHYHDRISLDTSFHPWQVKSQGNFDGIKAYQGQLSGNFEALLSKSLELSGHIALHQGDLNNTYFQTWLVHMLQMPSLSHVNGTDLSCRFKIEGRSRILDDIKLRSDDLDLNGFFHLDADDLVSSQASIQFSKNLLKESPIGRQIIGLVRGAWTFPIEFSLSGNVHKMNFQWDNSLLKDKVRQHMFSLFENMVDQRMNARLNYNVTIPNESVDPE